MGIAGPSDGADREGESDTGTEYTVSSGDVTFIPAGTVHWYRNETDEEAAFICAVPTGDDEIRVVDSAGQNR